MDPHYFYFIRHLFNYQYNYIRNLAKKVQEDQDFFKKAPKYTPIRRLDETKAARNPVLRWKKEDVIAAE